MLRLLGYTAVGVGVGAVLGFFGVGVYMGLAGSADTLSNAISSVVGGIFGMFVGFLAGFGYGYYTIVTGLSPDSN